jgi:hypothetical protein
LSMSAVMVDSSMIAFPSCWSGRSGYFCLLAWMPARERR